MSDPTPLRTVGTLAKSRFRPWLTWVALATIWCAVLLDQTWVFALLLTAWVIYDLRTGESLFIQRITRREQPVTLLDHPVVVDRVRSSVAGVSEMTAIPSLRNALNHERRKV